MKEKKTKSHAEKAKHHKKMAAHHAKMAKAEPGGGSVPMTIEKIGKQPPAKKMTTVRSGKKKSAIAKPPTKTYGANGVGRGSGEWGTASKEGV